MTDTEILATTAERERHPKSDFLKYIGTPFEHYILPIIPAGAKLWEESHLVAEQLGKIPGIFAHGPKAWFGFPRWTSYWTSHLDLKRWQAWQEPDMADTAIAVGMRLGTLVAIDIDENDEARADFIEILAGIVLGAPLCIRRREGSARRVLLYAHKPKTYPIEKSRVAWTVDVGGEVSAVEVLGLGQQVVLEGPHAKGAMHYWQDERGLTDLAAMSAEEKAIVPWLTIESIVNFNQKLVAWINDEGWQLHQSGRVGKARDPKKEFEIDSPTSPHLLPPDKRDALTKAIQAIDINHESLASYDAWFPSYLAICAAVGRDMEYFHEVVLPWLQDYPGNTEEAMEAKWLGFTTSSIGADYVYHKAARPPFNCKEAMDAIAITDDTLVALLGSASCPMR